ncbi:hypothetical protein ACVOMT_10830 [Sphingomonas panni]
MPPILQRQVVGFAIEIERLGHDRTHPFGDRDTFVRRFTFERQFQCRLAGAVSPNQRQCGDETRDDVVDHQPGTRHPHAATQGNEVLQFGEQDEAVGNAMVRHVGRHRRLARSTCRDAIVVDFRPRKTGNDPIWSGAYPSRIPAELQSLR